MTRPHANDLGDWVWLRPWILHDRATGGIWCLVCVNADETERQRAKDPTVIAITAYRRCRNRNGVTRFFRQHQRCAPHGW